MCSPLLMVIFTALYYLPHNDFTSASVALGAIVSGVNFLLWILLFSFPFVQVIISFFLPKCSM